MTDFQVDFGSEDYTYQDAYTSQLRMLKSIDRMVEKVMGDVQAWEPNEPTIAFFISDNGYQWGEHTLDEKARPYEDSVHVPLRMWAQDIPAVTAIKPRAYDYRTAANIDLGADRVDVMNVAPNTAAPGRATRRPFADRATADPPSARGIRGANGIGAAMDVTLVPNQLASTGGYRGYQYIENRILPPLVPLPLTFSEYYASGDMPRPEQQFLYGPSQLSNVFGSDGVRESNEPEHQPRLQLASQLDSDRRCSGTTPGSNPPPCP